MPGIQGLQVPSCGLTTQAAIGAVLDEAADPDDRDYPHDISRVGYGRRLVCMGERLGTDGGVPEHVALT